MALTIGNSAKPGGSWHAYGGSSYPNQEAVKLVMPKKGRLLELGAWIGGWSATCRARLCVWSAADGTLLGQSAQFTVANEGAGGPAGGNVALYTEALETPVELANGASFYVGFTRHPDDAHQVSTGSSGSGPHWHGRSGAIWPNDLGNVGGIVEFDNRRSGAYVADYLPIPGAHVYRSGAWVEAESVQLYRSGAWSEAESVQLLRSGSWTDSE